jgi:hypothetical protein
MVLDAFYSHFGVAVSSTHRQVVISGSLEAKDGFLELQDEFMRFRKSQPASG